MSTYMFLYCKDCKVKQDFVAVGIGWCGWLGNDVEEIFAFMSSHSAHDLIVASEHNFSGEEYTGEGRLPIS